MHKVKHLNASNRPYTWSLSITNAAMVIALAIVGSVSPATARAQSTTAMIFGQAPAGETVTASSATGFHRHQTVNKAGKYKITPLPQGDYTVTLDKDGQAVDKRSNIALLVGHNAEIDFACPNDKCAASENR
ncbi:MAG TPA: carboxypeptidase-like regulatory domain-containing protein [Dyella sp.]|nr:carboxypeptidase-like regulatory domain-containing protein [Dyella sp.]